MNSRAAKMSGEGCFSVEFESAGKRMMREEPLRLVGPGAVLVTEPIARRVMIPLIV